MSTRSRRARERPIGIAALLATVSLATMSAVSVYADNAAPPTGAEAVVYGPLHPAPRHRRSFLGSIWSRRLQKSSGPAPRISSRLPRNVSVSIGCSS
jgi:hypothetical protein